MSSRKIFCSVGSDSRSRYLCFPGLYSFSVHHESSFLSLCPGIFSELSPASSAREPRNASRNIRKMQDEVYPGFLQLSGFMSMNLDEHVGSHMKFYAHLIEGDGCGIQTGG